MTDLRRNLATICGVNNPARSIADRALRTMRVLESKFPLGVLRIPVHDTIVATNLNSFAAHLLVAGDQIFDHREAGHVGFFRHAVHKKLPDCLGTFVRDFVCRQPIQEKKEYLYT